MRLRRAMDALMAMVVGLAAGACQLAVAVSAPPEPVTLRQPDGTTFQAILEGDERYIHVTTMAGYTITHDRATNAWFYAVPGPNGELRSSNVPVGAGDPAALGIAPRLGAAPAVVARYRGQRLQNPLRPIVRAPALRDQDLPQPEGGPHLGEAVTGTGKPLVILADFAPDGAVRQHLYTQAQFQNMLFSTGTYPTGSMNDYFREISYGVYGVQGAVIDWETAPQTYAYYCDAQSGLGTYPKNSQGLCRDLVLQLDPVIDYSEYDTDGDGYVDGITIIFEGHATGASNLFWPHAWALNEFRVQLDGVWIFRYNICNEQDTDGTMQAVGVYCHEWSHVLGAPDLYDYDSGNYWQHDNDDKPVVGWCLMASGNWCCGTDGKEQAGPSHMCGYAKHMYMDWLTPTALDPSSPGQYTVTEAETTSGAQTLYRIPINGSATECFYIENRNSNSTGAIFDKRDIWNSAMDSGLLIYHVDETMAFNYGNNGPPGEAHYHVWTEDPGEPDTLTDYPYLLKFDAALTFEDSDQYYLMPGTGSCSSDSYGGTTDVCITGISYSGATMTFGVLGPTRVVVSDLRVRRAAGLAHISWRGGPDHDVVQYEVARLSPLPFVEAPQVVTVPARGSLCAERYTATLATAGPSRFRVRARDYAGRVIEEVMLSGK